MNDSKSLEGSFHAYHNDIPFIEYLGLGRRYGVGD